MTKINTLKSAVVLFALAMLPVAASAHETRQYEIQGVPYTIVVGSLGEPVVVDDKTGVEVQIAREGVPLAGAQNTLQVEMTAAGRSRVDALSPVYGAEGSYKTTFIATVPTTITYRLFGTLENVPVDVSFTCNPAGHPQAEEDASRTDIAEGVVQTLKRGAFGCPQGREALGFPEEAPSNYALALQMATDEEVTAVVSSAIPLSTDDNNLLTLMGLAIAVLAFMISVYSVARRNPRP